MAYPVCCQCKKPMPEEFWECEDDELQLVDSSSSCREPIPMSTVLLQIVKSSTGRADLSQTNRIGIQESAEALQIPYLFSTVRLLAEVQRIHDEEFNNHKALQASEIRFLFNLLDNAAQLINCNPFKIY